MACHRHFQRIALSCLLSILTTGGFAKSIIQINGRLSEIKGHPSWLILVRNIDTGSTIPWLYDFQNENSAWSVFPEGHDYQIVASELQFDQNTVFHNFCNIQDGILSGKSLQVSVSGKLTPFTDTLRCHSLQYPS